MQFEVELDKQHLERLGATAPVTGIIELIWNAIDADAEEIRVEFGRNELGGIEEIRVVDDGHGMTHEEALDSFRRLGGSWKRTAAGSQTRKRPLHGRDGRGRFRAAGLGGRIRWDSVAADRSDPSRRMRTCIELRLADLAHGETSEPEETDEPTGTRVIIDQFSQPPGGLGGEGPLEKLTGMFALSLESYKVRLIFDGAEIDPSAIQTHRADYPVAVGEAEGSLTVIEWARRMERGLYLCDAAGTPLAEQAPGIQAPGFEFTAYLRWEGFASDTELAVAHLGYGETKQVIEAAQERLRQHFKDRSQERRRELIDKWKEERVYPFSGDPTSPPEQATRDVFDVVAIAASGAVNASEKAGRRLSLRLLREALEQDPGSLHRVLREVLDLPQDRLDELSTLLDRTPLTALISTSKEIANRLEFLRGLEELVLMPDISKHVKERKQLHRILANETWVFGEEYALAADDESLTTVLKRHMAILGRTDLAEDVGAEVVDLEGHRRIVDLMLARSLEQNRNRREHLVIELKAPKVAVSDDEAQQIRKYAAAVAGDPRFDTVDVQWDFYVVSSEIRGTPQLEREESKDRPYGQIMNAKGIRVWVLTWADVIEAANHRLKFVRQHLGYSPNAQQALDYLRVTHDKYLPSKLRDDPAA